MTQENQQELDIKEDVLISFLQQTKDGKYTILIESSLSNLRISEEAEPIDFQDDYYYSIS